MSVERDDLNFSQISDGGIRSACLRLYACIERVRHAVNAIVPTPTPTPGAWADVDATVGFQNGWADWGSPPYYKPGYRFDADGTVRLRGLMAGGGLGVVAFTLPAQFRPSLYLFFPASMGGPAAGVVQVDPGGGVTPIPGAGATNASCTLDGITFSLN